MINNLLDIFKGVARLYIFTRPLYFRLPFPWLRGTEEEWHRFQSTVNSSYVCVCVYMCVYVYL